MTYRAVLSALFLAWSASSGSSPLAASRQHLATADIRAAIDLGTSGRAAPYQLAFSSYPAAAVYTPFVRVALLAADAARHGRVLTADEIPAQMLKSDVYVAMRWFPPAEKSFEGLVDRKGQTAKVAVVPSGMTAGSARRVDPIWTSGPGALRAFGPLPFDDIVAVSAFPREALTGGHDLVVYYVQEESGGRRTYAYRAARIRSADAASWR